MPPTPEPAGGAREELSERDARILEFERRTWRNPGLKADAIRSQFGLSPARYHQLLTAVLDEPAALRSDPILVRRLQRLRDERTAARAARVFRMTPADARPQH
jgi:hypothetical protein